MLVPYSYATFSQKNPPAPNPTQHGDWAPAFMPEACLRHDAGVTPTSRYATPSAALSERLQPRHAGDYAAHDFATTRRHARDYAAHASPTTRRIALRLRCACVSDYTRAFRRLRLHGLAPMPRCRPASPCVATTPARTHQRESARKSTRGISTGWPRTQRIGKKSNARSAPSAGPPAPRTARTSAG